MSQPIKGRGSHLIFRSAWKTNLVEDVEFLINVKFQQILFSSFRELKNVKSKINDTMAQEH